jgi:hypothetical protein
MCSASLLCGKWTQIEYLQAWTGPEGSRRLRLPDFKRYGTCRWQFSQPYFLVLISVSDRVDPRTKVRPEDLSMKNSNDPIGSRNRDHTACSTVPQPNELCRAPYYAGKVEYSKNYCYHNQNNNHYNQSRVKPASAPSNGLFKDLPSPQIYLFYNSALFVTSCCCSYLLHVVASLICIFLISRPLVLLSDLPKFLYSSFFPLRFESDI